MVQTLRCPTCGYDLQGAATGTCPECSRPFVVPELRARARAISVVALWLAGLASLGALAARAVEPAGPAPTWVESTFVSIAAAATGILNSVGAARSARGWIAAVLVVAVVLLLCGVSGFSAGHDATVPAWLQVHELLDTRWLGASAAGIVCILTAIVLARVAGEQESLPAGRGAKSCLVAAALSLGVVLISAGQERYMYAAQGAGTGPPAGSGRAILLSWTLHQDLMAIGRVLGSAAWLGLGAVALVLGAARLVAREP